MIAKRMYSHILEIGIVREPRRWPEVFRMVLLSPGLEGSPSKAMDKNKVDKRLGRAMEKGKAVGSSTFGTGSEREREQRRSRIGAATFWRTFIISVCLDN